MKKFQTLLLSVLLLANTGFSQSQSEKPIIIKPTYFDISPPLRDMYQDPNAKVDMSWKEGIVKNHQYPQDLSTTNNPDAIKNDPNVQSKFGVLETDTTIQNFEGVGTNNGVCPPDPTGDVGPNHYVQLVNLQYAIYNKSGSKILGPFNTNLIWSGMPNNENDGDGIVVYDEQADRWLISQFSLPNSPAVNPSYEMVAISQTNDPTGSWYRYQYTFTEMPDYPKFGVWQDAYYLCVNRFNASGNYAGPGAAALDRAKMLAGDAAASMVYFKINNSNYYHGLPADCDGTLPPAGTPGYFVWSSTSNLIFYEFNTDWTTPTNSTFTQSQLLTINPFSYFGFHVGLPQKGTSVKLDPLSYNCTLMNRLQFRKFSDHWSMVTNGTVKTGSNLAGIRWYEFRKTGTNPWSIYQQATYAPDDGNSRWCGSIAMDSAGNIGLAYSINSANLYASIRYTGRMSGDPLNQFTISESGIINGGGSQTNTWSGTPSRWGDYSGMSVDPSAPGTFWYTTEYYSYTSDASWQTRIASFSIGNLFASYATASPAVICGGRDSVQLKAVAYGGSGNYTYSWTSIPAGFTSTLKEPKDAPTQDTRYAVAVSDGSQTKNDTTLMVTVVSPPYVFAGNDTVVDPSADSIVLHGIATSYYLIQWQTTGNGTFGDKSQLNTTYKFGSTDKANKAVNLKLTAVPNSPCHGNVTSIRHIYLWTAGTHDISDNGLNLNIQPNPARENVSITISGLENTTAILTLLNMNGQTVYTADLIPSLTTITKQIDLSSFAKGVYIVRLKTDRSIETKQLVVQ